KFMPCFDGPYKVSRAHLETSTYTLDLPDTMKVFPTFHSSQLCQYQANDPELFPSRVLPQPGPMVVEDGGQEWEVERILD
ncbi:hypothetical protein JAAARDRAFT_111850, partial [Jaapia argillacea MUCL 33604]